MDLVGGGSGFDPQFDHFFVHVVSTTCFFKYLFFVRVGFLGCFGLFWVVLILILWCCCGEARLAEFVNWWVSGLVFVFGGTVVVLLLNCLRIIKTHLLGLSQPKVRVLSS